MDSVREEDMLADSDGDGDVVRLRIASSRCVVKNKWMSRLQIRWKLKLGKIAYD